MRLLLYCLACIAAFLPLYFHRWRKRGVRAFLYSLFYIYLCAVVYLTVLPMPTSWGTEFFDGDYGNFIPFHDLKMGYRGALMDILLNTVMTLPFGILYPQIRKSGLIKTALFGLIGSTFIECTQLLTTVLGSRFHAFDITDIITNTTGAILGYLCFKALSTISTTPKKR